MEVEKNFVNSANIKGKKQQSQQSRYDFKKIDEKIKNLEKKQEEIFELISKNPGVYIEKLIINRLNVGKLEMNLDSIDVKDLSGALNIGMNIGAGKPEKDESHKEEPDKSPKNNEAKK